MMRRLRKYILNILIIQIVLSCHISNAVITYPQCAVMRANTGCSCKLDVSLDMEILCPFNKNNSDIQIVIHRATIVHVTCRGAPNNLDIADSDALESTLPTLPIGPDVLQLIISSCHSFDVILQRLGISDAKMFELSASVNATNAYLTRQHLPKGLAINNLKLTNYIHLSAVLFLDCAQLKFIEIEAPVLELPHALFQPLTNIIGLTLKGRVTYLPVDIFSAQRRLLNMVLIDGALQSLKTPLFQYLPQLQSLHLWRNELTSVPPNALAPLRQLLRINLSKNRLRALSVIMFEQQRKIVSIDLSENELEDLPRELFARTTSLQELRLEHNRLKSLSIGLLAPLNYLKKLYLNNNQLRTLHAHTFNQNTELAYLNLQDNQIVVAEADACATFDALNHLSHLLLRNNSLTHLCTEPAIKKMGSIDLSHNRIERLEAPHLVALACSWAHVDLSNNTLQSILVPKRIRGAMHDVKALDCQSNIVLSYNALHCDCALLNFVLGNHRNFLTAGTRLNSTNLTCGSPAALRGRLVDKLQPLELMCPVIASYCPTGCHCWARTYDATLVVNCTQAQLKEVPALPSLANLTLVSMELDVTNNTIKMLPPNNTAGYALLKRIFAAGNQLRFIEASHLPAGLTYLDVRYNHLTQLSVSIYELLNASQKLSDLFLSHNPWMCNCSSEQLLIAAKVHHNRIRDVDDLICADAQYPKILELSFSDICPEDLTTLIALISLLTTGFLLAIASTLYFKYSLEINVWLYAHNACLCCVTEFELDKDKLFDAFISYSHQDEQFVAEELIPGLERGDIPYRICTHERNWLAGAYIPEQIVESVEQSRRTIIVLSQSFVESSWARMEFRTAHQSALNEGRTRIILIMYSDLTNVDALDTELQAYLKMNTYLKWNDPRFWNKLRYAMPHKRRSVQAEDEEPRYVFSAMELKDLFRRTRINRQMGELNI